MEQATKILKVTPTLHKKYKSAVKANGLLMQYATEQALNLYIDALKAGKGK